MEVLITSKGNYGINILKKDPITGKGTLPLAQIQMSPTEYVLKHKLSTQSNFFWAGTMLQRGRKFK